MPLRVAVLYGSARSGRRGLRLARFIVRKVEERGHHVDLVDPLETPLPFLDRMHNAYDPGTAPEIMERIHDVFEAADAFVVVTGEYNHSVPPVLKNLLDHYESEYHFKPAGIVSYSKGAFGGVRVAPHLRVILGELGMVTTRTMLPVPRVADAFTEDGTALDEAYHRRAGRLLDELEWYADALKAKRAEGKLPF